MGRGWTAAGCVTADCVTAGRIGAVHLFDQPALQGLHQPGDVVIEVRRRPHEDRIAGDQVTQRLGQFVRRGHLHVVEKHRDQRNVAVQGRLDLDADRVVRMVQPAPPLTVGHGEPGLADHGHQEVAGPDRVLQVLAEIDAIRNRIDIQKNFAIGELLSQPIVDHASGISAVVASVGDEDLGHAHEARFAARRAKAGCPPIIGRTRRDVNHRAPARGTAPGCSNRNPRAEPAPFSPAWYK